MSEILNIDGATGEGGGQIVRSALTLSVVLGMPFRIDRIRAGRRRPGLLRQHLTAVQAMAELSGAQVSGDELGSQSLEFRPGPVRSGRYRFAIGSAGSVNLVLQTVLPALMTASGRSDVVVDGGTHNPWAPPFEFIRHAYLPLLERMGPRLRATLERPGFYPAGGGRVKVEIEPVDRLIAPYPLDLEAPGDVIDTQATALVVQLSAGVARRELKVVRQRLGWPQEHCRIVQRDDSSGPGNVLTLIARRSDGLCEVVTGFGKRGLRAEVLAHDACEEMGRYLESGAAIGTYLADQLLLPLGLAGGGSFTTLTPSEHLKTNGQVLRWFTGLEVSMEEMAAGRWRISVGRS